MPKIKIRGAELHYTDDGNGTPILFSHGFLMSGEMFRAQVDHLSSKYRCITHDHRGQGNSETTSSGYEIDELAEDVAALIENLGIGPCHFVGLSMGGFIGMRLAARRPELICTLTLLNTSADEEPAESRKKYKMLGFVARWLGLRLVIGKTMPIMFGNTFMTDASRSDIQIKWRNHILSNDRIGITNALVGVTARSTIIDEINAIKCPVLIGAGEEDVATIPEKSKRIAGAIEQAELKIIPRSGHSSTIEEPEFVSQMIDEFLSEHALRAL